MKKNLFSLALTALFLLFLTVSCVKNEVKTLSLDKTTSNLILGETDSLKTNITVSGDISKFPQTWTSSNLTIASVNNGLITALKAGTSIITVKAGDKSATCQVTVDDKIITQFTSGNLDYYGDFYGTALSNNYVLTLYSNSDTLLLEVNTPLTVTDSIPSGTYEMINNLNLNDFSQFLPNTLLPAFQSNGNLYGSWFYNQRIFTPVTQGSITSMLKNTTYTIQYNLFDYFGNSISGLYTGTINYSNKLSTSTSGTLIKKEIKNQKIRLKKYNLFYKQ